MTAKHADSISFDIVIPTRFASTRLPGKPLRQIAGKSMVERVYKNATRAGADFVVVATDDSRIVEHVECFGGNVMMTSASHTNGTERIAEVVSGRDLASDAIIVNLQGDEPLVPPELLRDVAKALADHDGAGIATVATPIRDNAEAFDPNVVKVVMDQSGLATCFSRAPIPWHRDYYAGKTLSEASELPLPGSPDTPDAPHTPDASNAPMLRHLGLYAYRAAALRRMVEAEPCAWELAESLEQLRALWLGIGVHVTVIDKAPGHGVDTEGDLARVNALLSR